MGTTEKMIFLDTIEALLENYKCYKDFKLVVEPDPWHPDGDGYRVVMLYGEAKTEFITTGFNFAYNMRRLFNNDVFDKLLR